MKLVGDEVGADEVGADVSLYGNEAGDEVGFGLDQLLAKLLS